VQVDLTKPVVVAVPRRFLEDCCVRDLLCQDPPAEINHLARPTWSAHELH